MNTPPLIGLVMGSSLLIAYLLKLDNPYWIPISCIAVMQGADQRQGRQGELVLEDVHRKSFFHCRRVANTETLSASAARA